jgi:hypothetical protein
LENKTFKIEKSKVKISYCHPGVFVPVYTDSGKYSFKTASGNSIAYWDEQGYASEWTKAGKEPVPTDEEIEKFYNDIKGSVTAHTAGATIVQEPVLVSAPEPAPETSFKREVPTTDQQQPKKKRKVDPPSIKKPTAQIEKWASKREELRGQQTATPATTTESTVVELSEFADTTQMCCLLCKRKFQSPEEIQKHEKLSKLHKVQLALWGTDDRQIWRTRNYETRRWRKLRKHGHRREQTLIPNTETAPANAESNSINPTDLTSHTRTPASQQNKQPPRPPRKQQRTRLQNPNGQTREHSYLLRWAGRRGADWGVRGQGLWSLFGRRVMPRELDWGLGR